MKTLRFMLGAMIIVSVERIASMLGMSSSKIRQIETDALMKLRKDE